MKTAIVYYSKHHGNTKKVLDAIAAEYDVDLIDITAVKEAKLDEYDLIGFASGIYFGKMHEGILKFAEANLPENKRVFFICTYGVKQKGYTDAMEQIAKAKGADIVGTYGCRGFDTFGPFRLVGGIAKKHPDDKDISGAISFFKEVAR